MATIEETPLPGIGARLDFVNEEGRRMGIVRLHGGRRELFVCSPGDPDDTQFAVRLSESDAITLVEALGVVTVEEDDSDRSYAVEGLVFEWVNVEADAAAAGHTIADLRIRTRTGASIVAVLRPSGSVPAPEPTFRLEAGDTVVAAGTAEGVEAVRSLLQSG